MIIDATKINYFSNPSRSAFDYKLKEIKEKNKKEKVGVILDATGFKIKRKNNKGDMYE